MWRWCLLLACSLLLAACGDSQSPFESYTLGPLGRLDIGTQRQVEAECNRLGTYAAPGKQIMGCAPPGRAISVREPRYIAHEVCHVAQQALGKPVSEQECYTDL